MLTLLVLALVACSNTEGLSGATKQPVVVDEKAPVAGEPAKVVTIPKGNVYAFSFDENGQHVTCQAPVTLDANQKIVQQKKWDMNCTQPSLQQIKQLTPARELNLSSDALFDFDKSGVQDIKALGRKSVEQLGKLLRNEYSQQPHLVLTGYTDRIGAPEANQVLALARAQSVAEILQRSGIARDHITVLGKGSANPRVDCPGVNATPELIRCLQPNRRVSIQVIGN
ncbi:OmpA family protein [Pseudomonas sp. TH31]|uniref:OmpA family protein n=1 Tax=Pseudomonas sp. TH31 TaxID=2796396 RepID=UPI001914B328|nr:OmpA family protein [Pseudomonas sp. TH31]MBK5416199.1 OmpA family protein [Pseudomonas sp. TH31]